MQHMLSDRQQPVPPEKWGYGHSPAACQFPAENLEINCEQMAQISKPFYYPPKEIPYNGFKW